MKRATIVFFLLVLAAARGSAFAKDDDFRDVVRMLEQYYQVKHESLPFLARAGIKTAQTAARIAGGTKAKLAEAGSVKIAFFEDQDFSGKGAVAFQTQLNQLLSSSWSPLIQVLEPAEQQQTYIFVRNAGKKFNVLVVTIERREASVVQVDLKPAVLAELMRDPEGFGKAINEDAMTNDDQE